MCLCVPQCACGGQGQLLGIVYLFIEFWRQNSSHQACMANVFTWETISLTLHIQVSKILPWYCCSSDF